MYSHFQRIPFDTTGKTQKGVGSRNHFCQSQMGRNTDKCTELLVRACNGLEGSTGNTLGHSPHPPIPRLHAGPGVQVLLCPRSLTSQIRATLHASVLSQL